MENIFAKVEELSSTAKAYVDIRIKELKFESAEKTSDLLSYFISRALLVGIFLFALLFLSLAAAFLFNEKMGSSWIGFLIVSFIDMIIGLIIWKFRTSMIKIPIMNTLIKKIFKINEKN